MRCDRPTSAPGRGSVVAAAVLAAALGGRGAPAHGAFLDWITIAANEGGSSGGHAALRIGDETFHYQFERPGILELTIDPWDDFVTRYRLVENRTVSIRRVPVSDATALLIDDEFRRRHVAQAQRRACVADLAADARLLAAVRAARRGVANGVPVAGAGLFAATSPTEEPVLVALRARVGADVLATSIARVRATLADVTPADPGPPPVDDEVVPPCWGIARRWEDRAAALSALEALAHARPLRADAVTPPPGASFALDPAEITPVTATVAALADRITALARDPRPGTGRAMAVSLGRLVALDRTLRTGRWHLLDGYPPDANVLGAVALDRRRHLLLDLARRAHEDLEAARAALRATGAASESVLARVESTGLRAAELDAAIAAGRPMRLYRGPLLPERPGLVPVPELDLADDALDAALARTRDAAARWTDAYARRYGYALVTRNCATELFQTVATAVARATPEEPLDTALAERLGGTLPGPASLAFVPFLAAATIDARLPVAETQTLPSRRHEGLAAAAAHEGPLRIWLREGNTITSTLYRPNPDDSVFLFFTDDVVLARPVLGLANLAVGLGASIAGVASLPFDGGERLWSGLRGALFSLPELAFVNIRKGSFLVPPTGEVS